MPLCTAGRCGRCTRVGGEAEGAGKQWGGGRHTWGQLLPHWEAPGCGCGHAQPVLRSGCPVHGPQHSSPASLTITCLAPPARGTQSPEEGIPGQHQGWGSRPGSPEPGGRKAAQRK